MNDYEQQRLANIAKNEALLKEIGLTGIKPVKPLQTAASTTRKRGANARKRNVAMTEPVARRTSSRLSGIPVDSALGRQKALDDQEARLEQERIKKARIEGPIDLSNAIANASTWDEAKSTLHRLGDAHHVDVKDEIVAEETDLQKEFAALSLLTRWEPNSIKITPERIYCMEMHPGDKELAFAGDKMGNIGVWDIRGARSIEADKDDDDAEDAEQAEAPMIHHFKVHTRTVTSMMFDAGNTSRLYTGSYDGSVRCLDLESGVATESFASTDDQAITGLQVHPEGNTLFFTTLEGQLGMRDLRGTHVQFWDLHDRKIGALGLSPREPHYLVTSSLDRTMRIWDLRRCGSKGTRSKSDAPIRAAEHVARLSISSAFFNTRGSIVATSYDDSLKVFHESGWKASVVAGSEDAIDPDVVVAHNNTTGRWLTVFKAAWQRNPADGVEKFVIGNMARKMDVFDAQGQMLTQLENEYISAVPAVVAMHPSQNWVIGGNASGKALYFS